MFGTYQSRNASAQRPALALVAASDITPPTSTGNFAAMESSTMGTSGTPADGFHLMLDPALTALNDEPPALAKLDPDLAGASFVPGQAAGSYYNPIGVAIGTTTPIGDKQIGDFDGGLSGTVQASPGGGGGGGGSPATGCQNVQAQPAKASDYPGLTCYNMRVLSAYGMHPNETIQYTISSSTNLTTAELLQGDKNIWSLAVTKAAPEKTGPPLYNVVLYAVNAKAGHFAAAVEVDEQTMPKRVYCASVDFGPCTGGTSKTFQGATGSVPPPVSNKPLPPPARGA